MKKLDRAETTAGFLYDEFRIGRNRLMKLTSEQ